MDHAEHAHGAPGAHEEPAAHSKGQQHPLGIYFKIWGLLFVLSAASYMVDYLHFQGLLRWTLIIVFMLLKAGLIVAPDDISTGDMAPDGAIAMSVWSNIAACARFMFVRFDPTFPDRFGSIQIGSWIDPGR